MAIAFDARSEGVLNSGGGSTLTFSHTCTGSNLVLFVFADYEGTDKTITGATYNGVAMTAVYSDTTYNSARKLAFFYLVNPATGAHDVAVTLNSGATQKLGVCAASYTGAAQTGQPDSYNSDLDPTSVASKTISTTTASDFCWLVGGVFSGIGITAGSNTTIRSSQPTGLNDVIRIADSNGGKTPAGSHGLAYTISPNNQIIGFTVSFKPAANQTYEGTDTVTVSEPTTTANAEKASTITDTVTVTDSFTQPDWINAPKSSSSGWTNQSKS